MYIPMDGLNGILYVPGLALGYEALMQCMYVYKSTCYSVHCVHTHTCIHMCRFRLHGLQGRGTVRVSVATQNRSKCYKLVSNMEAFDLRCISHVHQWR